MLYRSTPANNAPAHPATQGTAPGRHRRSLRVGYAVHELMVTWLARPAALLTLGTGLVLSFGTPWRLTRYWWVATKLVLLVATVVVTVSLSPETLDYVIDRADAVGTPAYTDAQALLVLLAFYHVVMIGAAVALSIFKPGARRPGGSRRAGRRWGRYGPPARPSERPDDRRRTAEYPTS